MAFLCGPQPSDDDRDNDETEVDEQPTAPWPLPPAATVDQEAYIETWPKLPTLNMRLMIDQAKRAYARQQRMLEPFCPVCERFEGVEHELEPAPRTDKLRPRLCLEHKLRGEQNQELAQRVVRHTIDWYFRPDDDDAG